MSRCYYLNYSSVGVDKIHGGKSEKAGVNFYTEILFAGG